MGEIVRWRRRTARGDRGGILGKSSGLVYQQRISMCSWYTSCDVQNSKSRMLPGSPVNTIVDVALISLCVFGHDIYQTQWYLSFRNTSSKIICNFPTYSIISTTSILKHFSNQASGSSLFRIIGWKPWWYSRSQHCSSRPRSPISANSIRLDSWPRMRTRTPPSSRR